MSKQPKQTKLLTDWWKICVWTWHLILEWAGPSPWAALAPWLPGMLGSPYTKPKILELKIHDEINVFFKYFKHSWAQKETPVSGFQQRHSMVIVYKCDHVRSVLHYKKKLWLGSTICVDSSAFKSGCPVKREEFWLIWRGGTPKIIVIYVSHLRISLIDHKNEIHAKFVICTVWEILLGHLSFSVWYLDVMMVSANEGAVSPSQLGTRHLFLEILSY